MLKDIKIKMANGQTSFDGSVKFDRIEGNIDRAQYALDEAVMHSMVPYMPFITGTFVNLTRSRSSSMAGTGKVCAAAAPYGRFLYYGKTMVDPETGSTYARPAAKKVLVSEYDGKTNAKEFLKYTPTFHPKAEKEWFEVAKKKDKKAWIDVVRREAARE